MLVLFCRARHAAGAYLPLACLSPHSNSRENQAAIAKVNGIPKLVSVLLAFSNTGIKEQQALVYLNTLAASAIKELAKVRSA